MSTICVASRKRPGFVSRTMMVGSLLLCFVVPAPGQINDPGVQLENIDKLPSKQPVLEYALGGAFLLAALAIGFKPSTRNVKVKKQRDRSGAM